jgi:glycosyltransferase involved in cell wall biosynthesis
LAERHLITAEYPPQPGGVSDYTHLVASGLAAAGEDVHVWCPPCDGETPPLPGVTVHRELGDLAAPALRRAGRLLNRFRAPRRLLVQWVPHAFGFRSMNLFFCSWLWGRAAVRRDLVDIMVHEPFLDFRGGTWNQAAAAAVHRVMTVILLSAARRVWVSIPAWEACWRPYALHRRLPFQWLPVPSNIPVVDDPAGVAAARARYAPSGSFLVAHFGTYRNDVARLLMAALPGLLGAPCRPVVVLMGRGAESFRAGLVARHPRLAGRVHATGPLEPADVSRHLSACDAMFQPYPDGVSSRRTTVMVGLLHGVPVVTTAGPRTEPLWAETRAVCLAPVGDAARLVRATQELLLDERERKRMSNAARAVYHEYFDVRHTLTALRAAG